MKIKINKRNPDVPMVVRDSYYFSTRNGMRQAEITLAKDGEYILTIDGNVYSPYEASAKRSSHYKETIIKLSNQMHQALSAYNDSFTGLCKQVRPITNKAEIEGRLKKLVLKNYTRTKFTLPQPNKSETESDLKEEANMRFFSIWSSNSSKKSKFVSDNVDEEYDKRVENWKELKQYHESIQDYFEDINNKQYQQEYNQRKKVLEEELCGDVSYVKSKFEELSSICVLPFDITLECDYNQKDGIINAIATLPSMLYIPETKVEPLAFGKISIKEKLQREKDADTLSTLLGLAYYLAVHLFSLSVNINHVRLSVMTGFLAFYWVDFERNAFSTLSLYGINPLQDFFCHPHVIDCNNTSIELIQEDEFKLRVNDMLKVCDAIAKNKNLIVLSVKEAEQICNRFGGVDDLKIALQEAKRNNSTVVVANKRYQNVLLELGVKRTESNNPISSLYVQNPVTATNIARNDDNLSLHLDPMFEECAKLIVTSQQGSTSMLQRNFSIGYNRAGSIMDQLQKVGIVGPQIGAKPRDVLVQDFKTLETIINNLC